MSTLPKPDVRDLALAQIQPSPFQHRKSFPKDSLRELADSLQALGQVTPALVRPRNGHFELIHGERMNEPLRLRECSTCRFRQMRWLEAGGAGLGYGTMADGLECRRQAPGTLGWPRVGPHDWCGMYEPAGLAPGAPPQPATVEYFA